jgi:excisionase family DNA binding protein
MVQADEWLTVAEAAARLKAHPETVRRWLKAGRLRAAKPQSDKFGWRVRASEVERFLSGEDSTEA